MASENEEKIKLRQQTKQELDEAIEKNGEDVIKNLIADIARGDNNIDPTIMF